MIKFLNKHKVFLLKIYNLLPKYLQSQIKLKYRKQSQAKLYDHVGEVASSKKHTYKGESYNIASTLDSKLEQGVNLIGFPTGDLGLGVHIRSAGSAVDAAKINHSYYDCASLVNGSFSDESVTEKISKKLAHNTNLFVCNGDTVALLFNDKGLDVFGGRYNIHYGAWELSKYPEEWIPTLGMFDEYWAMSSFLQKSVSDSATIPVIHMPYPIDFEIPKGFTRKDFGLPDDKFLYVFTFDISSVMERKNPKAVIESFYAAFPKNDDVGLVIKVVRKKDFANQKKELDDLMSKLKNDKRIFLIDEILPRDKILGLINVCDVYVSLHRAEGLGIGMAEAMKMKKPVIATNYSGNTDFTLHDNSCLVDYKLIPLKPLDYIYEKGKVWADASTEHAAFYMKKLYEDKDYYNTIATKGKAFIDTNYSVSAIKDKYLARLKILGLTK